MNVKRNSVSLQSYNKNFNLIFFGIYIIRESCAPEKTRSGNPDELCSLSKIQNKVKQNQIVKMKNSFSTVQSNSLLNVDAKKLTISKYRRNNVASIFNLLLIFILSFFGSQSYGQTTLAVGDISIIGFNSNTPDNFAFVAWVGIDDNTFIKFTDNGFLSSGSANLANNARGGENFVIWKNNTGSTIPAGTVIRIENPTLTNVGTIVSGNLSGISNGGDNIFAYQGAATSGANPDFSSNLNPTTFSGSILHGVYFQGSGSLVSWRTTGVVSSNDSYLPSQLNIANGNIVLAASASRGEYTGLRSNQTTLAGYKALVNNPVNWTTAAGVGIITLSTTGFTTTAGSITGAATAMAFTTTYGTPSVAQTFAISASGVTSDLIATAPTGFEVSNDGLSYGPTATFTQTAGSASGTLSIRLKATAIVSGTYNSQNIVLSAGGAGSVNITSSANGNIVSSAALAITGVSGVNKEYDGNNSATLTGTPAYVGLVNGESFSVTGTPTTTFASTQVANGISLTVVGYTSPSANYILSQPTSLTADITPKPLTISGLTASNKVEDGNTTATLSGTPALVGVVSIDLSDVSISGTYTANFASAAVANNIPVTVSGYSLAGSAAGNYSLTQPTGLTANITSAALQNQTITFNALSPVTYGDADFNLSASAISGLTVSYVSSNTNVASVAGNVVTIVGAGVTTITASQSGNSSYNPAPNVDQLLTVNQKQLTVIGATGQNKVYDGNVNAVILNATLSGVIGFDDVILSGSGTFADANVGIGKLITTNLQLGGADVTNYSLLQPTGITADITTLGLTINGLTANNKIFDGTTNATLSGIASLLGVIPADVPNVVLSGTPAAQFASSTIGNGIAVTVSGYTLTGNASGNYSLTQPTALTANITAAPTVLGAGDIAIIGYNTSGSPDNFAILILKDLAEGTKFYINDNEVATSGSLSFADLSEGEASFTVNAGQTIVAGTVIVLPWGAAATTTTQYTYTSTTGAGLGNNNEEIYIYNAPSITSTTASSFIYFAKIGSSSSLIPAGLTLGTTTITPNGTALRYSTTGALYNACVPALLQAIGSTSTNWNNTGATTIAAIDWTFTIQPACPNSVSLSVSANTGSENDLTVITVTATASSAVLVDEMVDVSVSGTDITGGDYTLSNTTITILAGTSQGSVTFTIVNDLDLEATETATLTLNNPTSGIVLGSIFTQNIIIIDNDAPVNSAPTISFNETATSNYVDGGTTTSPSSPFSFSGVINDPTDPLAILGIVFSVNDAETLPASLTVSATSSNASVVANANLLITGLSNLRTLTITPNGVGYSTITVSVSDGVNTTNYLISYAASAAATSPTLTRFHIGRSDASTVVQIDADYMYVADDENQALRLYNRNQSGVSLNSFDYTTSLGLTDISGGIPREVDIESSTKLANRIFWLGSHDNSSSGSNRPNRSRVFATDLSGTGNATTLSYVGRYDGLKTDLLAWDQSNGHGLGADYFGLVASAATGVIPEAADGSGFNIEGLVIAPDNSTAYICFRAPIVPVTSRTKALIVPVTNFTSLFSGNPTTGINALFGIPIQLDLGGRGIREIKKNDSGQYLIIAGPVATSTDIAPANFVLYAWSGNAVDAPVALSTTLSSNNLKGSFEGIVTVPDPLIDNASVQLVVDNGDAIYYNDAVIAKDLTEGNFKKATSAFVTINGYLAAPIINSSLAAQTFTGLSFSYAITALNNPSSFSATGLPAGLTLNASGIISGTASTAGTFSISISATNASGTDTETLMLTVGSGFILTEIFINPPSTDGGQETIEIKGTPNTSLAGISLLVVEGDGTGAGAVDLRLDLSAYSTGSNGLLLIRDAATTLLPAPDAGTNVAVLDFNPDIENGTNTFVIGAGVAPALNSDLDSDNDGTLNVGAFNGFTAMDAVSLLENDGTSNYAYADDLGFTVLGPFTGFNPDALYRTFNDDETTCIWTGGDLLGSVGGPYTFDFAANRIFGFQQHGIISGVDLNLGTANQLFDTDVNGIANACEPLTVSGVVTNETCTNLDNGLIALQVFGGKHPYTFAWSNGSTDQSIDSLNATVYSVTVTDFVGATYTASFTVLPGAAPTTWYLDFDGDTFGNGLEDSLSCTQPVGFVSNNTDCNDAIAAINPAAQEICDGGIDNDCDALVDDNDPSVSGQNTYYADVDGDGFGVGAAILACIQPANTSNNNTDCNDAVGTINPGAQEICDGIDNDCDALVDNNDPSVTGQNTYYADIDGDGYGAAAAILSCTAPANSSLNNLDCNDAVGTINPAAQEICDGGIDNDCDALVDTNDPSVSVQNTYYADVDGDGFGAGAAILSCTAPTNSSVNNLDCNDGNNLVNPNATEVCSNLIDDNCNGQTDEGCSSFTYYLDFDMDSYGDATQTTSSSNPVPPAGYVSNANDCNDNNNAIHPGAAELCNNIDDNCNGTVDEGLTPITAIISSTSGQFGYCPSGSVTLEASPANPGNTFLWSNGAVTSSIVVQTVGIYSVTITNASGCSSTSPSVQVVLNTLPSDFDNNGITNVNDFLSIVGVFNLPCVGCPEDMNNDGVVNVNDFLLFVSEFGLNCQ